MHQDFKYAIERIKEVYASCLEQGSVAFIFQVTNENRGFSEQVISDVREALKHMHFELPTHISMLPVGKRPSSKKLFDGLEEVFCNHHQWRDTLVKMQQQKIKSASIL